jgi:hypothetical protein
MDPASPQGNGAGGGVVAGSSGTAPSRVRTIEGLDYEELLGSAAVAAPQHAPVKEKPAPKPAPVKPKPLSPAPAASVSSPSAPATQPSLPGTQRRRTRMFIYGGAGGGALVALVVVALIVWKPWQSGPPRLNEGPSKIASFTTSNEFSKLPFDRQVVYLKQMDAKEDALVEAYRAGRMGEEEYRKALEAAYLGRQLGRMKKYFDRTPGAERDAYLDKLLARKEAEKRGDTPQPKLKADGTLKQPKVDAKDAEDLKDLKRDDSEESAVIKSWPADVQKQWQEFHSALRARKRLMHEQELKLLKAKMAATQPAGNK